MKTILNKKHIVTLSILLIVDIIIISSAILYYQPDNSISIALLFIIPKIFLANLIIAGILYFIKKYYAIFFIINAFLSPCLLYFLFVQYIEISYRNSIDSWEFFIDNIKYTILYSNINKKGNYYTIEYSPEPSISIGERKGIAIIRNDTIYFTETDSTMYFIYNSYLYNYKETDKIKVRKKY